MSVYRSITTLQRFEDNMLFANSSSGGSSPFARRLRCLLLAGCALAISHAPAFSQDAQLRGSVDEDNLSVSSPDQTANRDTDPADPNAPASADFADSSYTPPADNAAQPQPTEPAQAAPTVEEDAQPFLSTDNMRVGAITTEDQDDTGRARRENLPAIPEQGRRATPEADPFAPLGLSLIHI